MNEFFVILVCAVAVETVFEIIKDFVKEDRKPNVLRIGSAVIGILFAINYDLDILKALEISGAIPYFGVICSGLCISKGSNFVHDLLERLTSL